MWPAGVSSHLRLLPLPSISHARGRRVRNTESFKILPATSPPAQSTLRSPVLIPPVSRCLVPSLFTPSPKWTPSSPYILHLPDTSSTQGLSLSPEMRARRRGFRYAESTRSSFAMEIVLSDGCIGRRILGQMSARFRLLSPELVSLLHLSASSIDADSVSCADQASTQVVGLFVCF